MKKYLILDHLNTILPPIKNFLEKTLENKADKNTVLYKTEQTLTESEIDQIHQNLHSAGKDVSDREFTIDGEKVIANWGAITLGNDSIALGSGALAEGLKTISSGFAAHAEGYSTKAKGTYSHAEGYNTEANADSTHAEGYSTKAFGNYSHAEGYNTKTNGSYSHAEGLNTTANGHGSHVQGRNNIIDNENKYTHIVGNGSNESERSNAHTLDWSGNAWFAGDVYTGSTSGTNKDDGSKKLATEEYVNNALAEFTPDSTIPTQMVLADQVTGEHYVICIQNGNLVTYKAES